ncbi:glycosyltransferase [Paenibacillus wynnii]|uniref:Capsular biosynthesis protein n=1 Tax=Paenibacillus wynnii TaxID=268407 RepID=A0A098MBA7_9BACL|nr:glycosyltransferase [Paenibacillus wynnii]KGE19333.1 capsular biosynthesis protein [Paenibacillus wynnii]
MKKILITSYDMEVGGVERSLASMLEHFDYDNHDVDLMLYRHQGDFLDLLSPKVNLLEEQPAYSTFRKTIQESLREGHYRIAMGRILAKIHTEYIRRIRKIPEPGYYQMQLMWKYVLPYLPKLQQEYDVAISYLWPHYFVADKVKAKLKIGWIHTDYLTIETDIQADFKMWSKFDYIIAVSEACKVSFLQKYGSLEEKVVVIENITSPDFIRIMANKEVENPNPMVDDPNFKLVTVGRLSYQKGFDLAVKALRSLKDKGYDKINWYIVGYGNDEAMLKEMIAEHHLEDSFILLGKQTNPYPYMSSCDLYVQPSRYEGKAVTVTEAKILGKPILITNYSTAPSQVTDGLDGSITELSVEGIVQGIERLYLNADLRQRLSGHCSRSDHSNTYELEKLYGLISEREEAVLSAI